MLIFLTVNILKSIFCSLFSFVTRGSLTGLHRIVRSSFLHGAEFEQASLCHQCSSGSAANPPTEAISSACLGPRGLSNFFSTTHN